MAYLTISLSSCGWSSLAISAAGGICAFPAVASNRIKELEKYLGVRLFNRTTRQLSPTEHGRVFYEGARKVLMPAEADAR